jgi:hypothetical protein
MTCPPPPGRGFLADEIYAQVGQLKAGTAIKVEFETETHANYIRSKLRVKAKKDGKFMSSSRSEDGKTRYFWIEKL